MRYGEDSNDCSAVKLQFDAGRGTVMRLAELNISPEQLNAVFFTHMHTDHTEGFADLVTLRWMFFGAGPKIDAVCSSDVVSTLGFTISCQKFTTHVAIPYSIWRSHAASFGDQRTYCRWACGPDQHDHF